MASLDHVGHFAAQRGVVEHHQVDVEQRALFRAQLGREFGRQRAHVAAHPFQGVLEQRQLGFDVGNGFVRDHFQVSRRQHDESGTHGGARRTGNPDKLGFLDALALTTQTTNRAGGFSVGNNPCQLRAHRDQEGLFALVELTALLLLDHQHPHHTPVVNDRCAQEGGITLFTGLGKVAIARVVSSVFQVQRLFAGTHEANQTFVRRHADLADGPLVQALGGHQHEAVGFRIEQIDRADLAAHGLLDA